MNYSELQQSNINDDLQQRREYLQKLTDKELVATINPLNDSRNVMVAKELLIKRGVEGVPS